MPQMSIAPDASALIVLELLEYTKLNAADIRNERSFRKRQD